jgi:hypothetical protein
LTFGTDYFSVQPLFPRGWPGEKSFRSIWCLTRSLESAKKNRHAPE